MYEEDSDNMMQQMYPGMAMPPQLRGVQPIVEPQQQLTDIQVPGVNDVMCGRGGGTNNHIGNIRFRQLVNGHKLRYLAATKSEKPMVSKEVVTIWRGLQPPGRFLQQSKKDSNQPGGGTWSDIGVKKAREKASQCLRERTPEVLPFVKKLDLQMKYQQEAENLDKGDDSSRRESKLKADDLSRELLQEQQQAAITAHQALNAYLPMSIMKMTQGDSVPSMAQPQPFSVISGGYGMHDMQMPQQPQPMQQISSNNFQYERSNSMPIPMNVTSQQQDRRLSLTHSQYPHDEMQSMPQQSAYSSEVQVESSQSGSRKSSRPPSADEGSRLKRKLSAQDLKDQIQKEIEELQQAQARLEAEAKETDVRIAMSREARPKDILNQAYGINNDFGNNLNYGQSSNFDNMTKEEYNNSVNAYMGKLPSNGTDTYSVASEEKSDHHRRKRDPSFDNRDDFTELFSTAMDTNQSSWAQNSLKFDDESMNSHSHGLHDLEPLDIRDSGIIGNTTMLKHSDKSLVKDSLLPFESNILENMMPTDIDSAFQKLPTLPNSIKENEACNPSPRNGSSHAEARSSLNSHLTQMHNQSQSSNMTVNSRSNRNVDLQNNHYSSRHHHNSNYLNQQQNSTKTMMSDLSDADYSVHAITQQKFESISRMKKESVYSDVLSDVSRELDNMSMGTAKSTKG